MVCAALVQLRGELAKIVRSEMRIVFVFPGPGVEYQSYLEKFTSRVKYRGLPPKEFAQKR